MKNEMILEAEAIETPAMRQRLGIAFSHAHTVKALPVEVQPDTGAEIENRKSGFGATAANFFKPAISNVFLLGCLLGLFVLYCCSCVIHALSWPAREKSS
jgi:hypothetical protein